MTTPPCFEEYFDRKYLGETQKPQAFDKPFIHFVLPKFIRGDKVGVLRSLIKQNRFKDKQSDLFRFLQTEDFASINNEEIKRFYDYIKSKEFISFLEKVTGLKLKADIVDVHATIYRDTHFLLCHDDELEGRKLAFLFYLTDLEAGDGGVLELFEADEGGPLKVGKRIIPRAGDLVLFSLIRLMKKSFWN